MGRERRQRARSRRKTTRRGGDGERGGGEEYIVGRGSGKHGRCGGVGGGGGGGDGVGEVEEEPNKEGGKPAERFHKLETISTVAAPHHILTILTKFGLVNMAKCNLISSFVNFLLPL